MLASTHLRPRKQSGRVAILPRLVLKDGITRDHRQKNQIAFTQPASQWLSQFSPSVVSLPNTAPAHTPAAEQTRWFAEEVQPHEASLRSYIAGSFPTVRDVDDVVQESYLRLWKARSAHPIQCARAYLFGIAQRFAVDVIRKEIRTIAHNVVMDLDALNVLEETADAAEAASTKEEIALLAEAIHSLPARCREIVIMRKLDQLSHQEIARRLGISVSTVEVQIFRGMEKCTRYLRSRKVSFGPRGNSP
ncbi:MAG: RNA polymerase sigma factor [Opitutaceae bacterium]|nr:RNA polymerase sigma factor [Opitutaceae bacterium]